MKKTKKIVFNVNQSRRIIRSAERHEVEPEDLLDKYKKTIDQIYTSWKENYEEGGKVDFQQYFLTLMKYAEVKHRLQKSKSDIKDIREMANILKEAIEEYKTDYSTLKSIENTLKNMGVKWT